MGKEKQSKLMKIESFKEGCISHGKGFRISILEFMKKLFTMVLI